jgi:hypothetical protein
MTLREAVKLLSAGRGFRDGKRQTALEIVLTYCLADIGRESLEREPDPERAPVQVVIRDEAGPLVPRSDDDAHGEDRCTCEHRYAAHDPKCLISGCDCKMFDPAPPS